ncbi:poly-gamma-glutamate synthase PgsB [candidate division KSB1 bacterium]
MIVLLITTALLLIYLIAEKILLEKWIRSVPLRISVTGTRGKSTVVRLLASVFRENGFRVLAKVTGSSPVYIMPDGEETAIKRRGMVTILEQKKLLKKAADLKAEVLISEIMSIHPENHYVESQKMIKPDKVIVTNFRKDHISALGETVDGIAAVYSLDVPSDSKVFIHDKEMNPAFESALNNISANIVSVKTGDLSNFIKPGMLDFSENLELVSAVCRESNIGEEVISGAISKTLKNTDELNIWEMDKNEEKGCAYFVQGFSINDPESTMLAINKIVEVFPGRKNEITGLLILRSDREERTKQWLDFLQDGNNSVFKRIFVIGKYADIFKRKLNNVDVIRSGDPAKIMQFLDEKTGTNEIVFGFGNYVGTGKELTDYWKLKGDIYGV